MSWRFLIVVLLVAAGASAWGGLHLGDWLVVHAPVAATDMPGQPKTDAVPVLDANGHPYTAQPPQPLVNGGFGIPKPIPPVAWELPEKALVDASNPNAVVDLATTTITEDEAKQIAAAGGGTGQPLVGIADVGGLNLGGLGTGGSQPIQQVQPVQPVQPVDTPPPPPAPPLDTSGAWRVALHREILACDAQSFFERPSCAWTARKKYCEPNNAWGKVPDCPAKSF
ncbi:hypothetical protein KVP10_03880 [Candidimonas humi]|uniref:Uncharacterized protein n=1 Tax=Candidimonas humi TaxID=683355 RepID=A0ABV8P190_9BURK|nr:hypothetical protein [Candidimonas humi]MBV6304012.1 hypothetical protein [Candidimonas humi]